MENPLLVVFIGIPAAFAIFLGAAIFGERVLKMEPGENNTVKTVVYGVILFGAVIFAFWLAAQTGWWG